ncbi:MAG: ROK family protein, partial [Bacteroidota bacterium]
GVPGPMVPSKTRPGSYVVNPRSLPTWRDVPIDALLEEELGVPVLVENNAMAAAVGERWYGAGQHISTFFYVYFGSGLGGGMVVGGHPYSGNRGNAGELGFIPSVGTSMLSLDEVAGDGTPTGEPLEHSGAFFNLPRLFRLLTQSGTEVSSPDALSALLAQEHPVLLRWIDEATRQLTTLILTVGYLLDPEAIFFGGRLPDDVLRAMLQGVWKRFSEKHDLDELLLPELKLATAGTEAAALGVAALPLHDFLNPQHGLSGRSQDVSVSSRATSVVNEAG